MKCLLMLNSSIVSLVIDLKFHCNAFLYFIFQKPFLCLKYKSLMYCDKENVQLKIHQILCKKRKRFKLLTNCQIESIKYRIRSFVKFISRHVNFKKNYVFYLRDFSDKRRNSSLNTRLFIHFVQLTLP